MSTRPTIPVPSADGLGTYDEPRTSYVWISGTSRWRSPITPIFHSIGDYTPTSYTTQDGAMRKGWEVSACCGPLITSASWIPGDRPGQTIDYRHADNGTQIPIRWALQFGRPCKRCWP